MRPERVADGVQCVLPVVDQLERAYLRQPLGYATGVVGAGFVDLAVAGVSVPQHQVVLGDDLARRAGEVQRERGQVAAEVVDAEDKVLGQVGHIPPDDPAHAQRREAELVTGGVDRRDPRNLEVPFERRLQKGRDEASRGRVDVDGDVQARSRLYVVERHGELADRLVDPGVGHAQRRYDANRVLVAVVCELLRLQAEGAAGQRYLPEFDIEVPGELVPADLHRPADQVRPAVR